VELWLPFARVGSSSQLFDFSGFGVCGWVKLDVKLM
jgi:hypothetical protein